METLEVIETEVALFFLLFCGIILLCNRYSYN